MKSSSLFPTWSFTACVTPAIYSKKVLTPKIGQQVMIRWRAMTNHPTTKNLSSNQLKGTCFSITSKRIGLEMISDGLLVHYFVPRELLVEVVFL
uniref:Uncharacterized protein n=1 Tax=Jakoba libera TaxID=143017 RepID=M4Q9T7_JAKLI|nr:hypothetical protein L048_p079 [Jakoba libera]AGH24177.1 hypothetical protein [Jakoba libera]